MISILVNGQITIKSVIYFDQNEFALSKTSKQKIDSLVTQLNLFTDYQIGVNGHTDDVGSNSFNDSLSQKRVKSTIDYLVASNVLTNKIQSTYHGEIKPIIKNSNATNRALNRRVEITVVGNKNTSTIGQQSNEVPVNVVQNSSSPEKIFISYGRRVYTTPPSLASMFSNINTTVSLVVPFRPTSQ